MKGFALLFGRANLLSLRKFAKLQAMTHKTTNSKIEKMVEAGLQYGYSPSTSHPKMKPFIASAKSGASVFDLEKVQTALDAAKEAIKNFSKEKKNILFVGSKKEAKNLVQKYADSIGMPYVNERWLGGILTNFSEIKKRLEFLSSMAVKKASGEFEKYTKKERLLIDEKITRMKRFFDGLAVMKGIPAALVIVDTKEEKSAVREAKKMGVKVIALMNSDCNLKDADYSIPANDAAVSSINYVLNELTESYKDGVGSQVVSN